MQNYDAYLFDWDGTLATSHDFWLAFFREQLERRNKKLTDKEIVEKIFGRPYQGFKEFGLSEAELYELEEATIRACKERMVLAPLYPDAAKLLHLLASQNKKLALVTASLREVVDIAIANHDLLELFDVVITGDEVKAPKPDPDGILTVLQKFGAEPSRAIMIGDSPKDLLAAKNAGTDSLLFCPREHEAQYELSELMKCEPIYTIRSWRELIDQLQ